MSWENDPYDHASFVRLLTVCCLVTFGCYFAGSMRLPVLPLYARGFDVSTAQIGVINSAFYLVAGILSLPSGMLSDLLGRKRLAVYGSVILLLGMVLLYFGRSYFFFTVVYLLLGAGIAAFGPTMMSWVAEISPPSHLGRAYGWYTTALFCGLGLGPAAGGVLGKWMGLQSVFIVGAVLVAVNLWVVWRFLPSQEPPAAARDSDTRWRESLVNVLTNRPLIGCWLVTLGACTIAGTFFSFMPLHADHRGLDVGQIGIVFLVQAISNAMSRIPFGVFSDRIGHRKYQGLIGNILVTLSITAFAPVETFYHFLFAGLALGVSMGVAFTSIGALIAETVAPRYRGLAMGGYNGCIYFGLMLGSIGMGPLIEMVGFRRGFLLTGLVNIPFIAFYAWSMLGYSQKKAGAEPAG
jgi:DHA1 family multidrug resistance protein-like MFS transporter